MSVIYKVTENIISVVDISVYELFHLNVQAGTLACVVRDIDISLIELGGMSYADGDSGKGIIIWNAQSLMIVTPEQLIVLVNEDGHYKRYQLAAEPEFVDQVYKCLCEYLDRNEGVVILEMPSPLEADDYLLRFVPKRSDGQYIWS